MASESNDTNGNGDDPFENLTLDEAFVQNAKVQEEDATTRLERLRRIDREHRELHSRQHRDVEPIGRPSRRFLRHRVRPTRGWITVAVVLLAVALYGTVLHPSGTRSGTAPDVGLSTLNGDALSKTIQISGGQPSKSREEQPVPLGVPAPLSGQTGPFVFMGTQPDSTRPVAYDPCRPLHVVVNGRRAPSAGDPLLRDAVANVTAATGLQIVIDGSSDEVPATERLPFQPERYGDVWAPVLVAWSDPTETPELAGDVAGLAGSSWVALTAGSVYLTGSVTLDGVQIADILSRPDGYDEARAVVEHELGHLVGLAHVEDPTQLMNPSNNVDVNNFAAGDLIGLSQLGQGACFPEI